MQVRMLSSWLVGWLEGVTDREWEAKTQGHTRRENEEQVGRVGVKLVRVTERQKCMDRERKDYLEG